MLYLFFPFYLRYYSNYLSTCAPGSQYLKEHPRLYITCIQMSHAEGQSHHKAHHPGAFGGCADRIFKTSSFSLNVSFLSG